METAAPGRSVAGFAESKKISTYSQLNHLSLYSKSAVGKPLHPGAPMVMMVLAAIYPIAAVCYKSFG
jgi:hypothetical protein